MYPCIPRAVYVGAVLLLVIVLGFICYLLIVPSGRMGVSDITISDTITQADNPAQNPARVLPCKPNPYGCIITWQSQQKIQLYFTVARSGALFPFSIKLKPLTQGEWFHDITAANLELEGISEYMGYNFYFLQYQSDPEYGSHFYYAGYLPVCTSKLMQWQAKISLQGQQQKFISYYAFEVQQ